MSMNDFDKQFHDTFRRIEKAQKMGAALVVGYGLVVLSLLGLTIWAACHFIAKFW